VISPPRNDGNDRRTPGRSRFVTATASPEASSPACASLAPWHARNRCPRSRSECSRTCVRATTPAPLVVPVSHRPALSDRVRASNQLNGTAHFAAGTQRIRSSATCQSRAFAGIAVGVPDSCPLTASLPFAGPGRLNTNAGIPAAPRQIAILALGISPDVALSKVLGHSLPLVLSNPDFFCLPTKPRLRPALGTSLVDHCVSCVWRECVTERKWLFVTEPRVRHDFIAKHGHKTHQKRNNPCNFFPSGVRPRFMQMQAPRAKATPMRIACSSAGSLRHETPQS
jgi:hypothetical protein